MNHPKFGTDEWVAQIGERQRQQNSRLTALLNRWRRLPLLWQVISLLLIPALIPLLTHNDYIIQIGGLIWLYATLALGLNVMIGYAGLLDLGYVAFFGLGGYGYAFVSSPQFGLHWPTWVSVPIVTLVVVGMGFLLGLPSLRLRGDYLAIVTLAFGQIFVQLVQTLDRVSVPWSDQPLNITGGPNGIPNLDRVHLAGIQLVSVTSYYYLLLALLTLIMIFVFHVNQSRLGRAWRAIREDTLAASAMGIPTNRLQLYAFATGAGIAGCCGAIFAAWQQGVFPDNFGVALLITLYAMVVLGGVGSLAGMVAGSFVLTVLPEVLRPGTQIAGTELAQLIFYGSVLALLAVGMRRRLIPILIALVVGGLLVRLLVSILAPGAIDVAVATPAVTGLSALLTRYWLVIPPNAASWGNLAFFVVVGVIVLITRLPNRFRPVALVVMLYLLAFVWETRLSQEPSTTRLLLVGVLLVVLMNYRPQGLFGKRQVEIA